MFRYLVCSSNMTLLDKVDAVTTSSKAGDKKINDIHKGITGTRRGRAINCARGLRLTNFSKTTITNTVLHSGRIQGNSREDVTHWGGRKHRCMESGSRNETHRVHGW